MKNITSNGSTIEEKTALFELQLSEIWKRILNVNHVRPTDNFFELGGDSIKAMEFAVAFSKRFGTQIPPSNLVESTLHDIAKALAAQQNPRGILGILRSVFRKG